jgi:DNA-binding transcriptional regulator YdaS (Cro superfamily)
MSTYLTKDRNERDPKITIEDLAARIGIDKGTLSRWENGRVPAERVLEVERLTGVSRHDLRPDLYPREDETRPVAPSEDAA